MQQGMLVTKRNGKKELINLDKIHKVVTWAAEGLSDVSVSQVEMRSQIQFFSEMKTEDIHKTMIKSAADLISTDTPDYQYLASRLLMFNIRKQAYGGFKPPKILDHVVNMVNMGKYDSALLTDFSEEDYDVMEKEIVHDRDMDFSYAAVKQLEGKYLVQNRVTGEIYESPQMLYMLAAAALFSMEKRSVRMKWVIDAYHAFSTLKISLPTPIMAGVRTPTRQFSSCVLTESGDSLDSINATTSTIVKYISQRAGIGINAGRIRALGSSIRGGEASHTGCIPFYKMFQAAVKSCSQGAVRGGAATLFYPLWHLEAESLLVLKNNRGVDANRVRHLDYGVQLNKLMYERLIKGGNITLFSPNEVPGLYDAFFEDQEKFEELYVKYEADDTVRKSVVKAVDLFSLLMQERSSTGRIYIQNVDHCNTHSPFDPSVAPIRQSNLCVAPETNILTSKGYKVIKDLEGKPVTVWNGKEWSDTVVSKTGENQELLTVETSSGMSLDCTHYHKFYVSVGYKGKVKEVRASDLKVGDKLIKFDTPVIDGTLNLDKAYVNCFYSGDGCFADKKQQRVYLYGEKIKLLPQFEGTGYSDFADQREKYSRVYFHYKDLEDKFFVPNADYTIKSRLDWLSGYLDADGCIYRNGSNQQLTAVSTNVDFLKEVVLMLQTLGVTAKVTHSKDEGFNVMPLNNGTGESGEFYCKATYRLLITSVDSQKLLDLGLSLKRLKLTKSHVQRDAKQFIKVTAIIDNGRTDDTYCFTESKRHMGMFNGLLTGQCLEIALPTKPLNDIKDEEGEIALCTLSAINLGSIKNLDELEYLSNITVRALDNLLDYQGYPVKAAENASKRRRTLGVGVINLANYFAKNGVRYSDGSANNLTHELFESLQYFLLKASLGLAKEKGKCDLFGETTYSQGILPIDSYKKEIDKLVSVGLKRDWETLRKEIVEHGLRNSTLTALMPSETSSQISNATNGIEPPRGLVSVKASKDGILKQVVPDFRELKDKYELLWNIPDNKGYLELVGIMQKFVDQAISANTNYDPKKFPNNKVPMNQLLKDLLMSYKLGLKTLYYQNTRDGAEDNQTELVVEVDDCESGACKI